MLTPHPKIPAFSKIKPFAGGKGFRMPAEWEPLEAIWVVPPHNEETWPGCFEQVKAQHAAWREAMKPFVRVRTTDELGIQTDDSWIRDFGPIFVTREVNGKKEIGAHDFFFNAWGGKYEGERSFDNTVPQEIAAREGFALKVHDFVLEGGSIEVNGSGTLLTTAQCLYSSSRNPWLNPAQIEAYLHESLGTTNTVWLPGGISGDDTDGHIDDIARFVAKDRIVCVSAPEGHDDHEVTTANLKALREAKDENGRKFEVIELPFPEPLLYDFPVDDHYRGGGVQPVPASYANFIFGNGALFVPVFGQAKDDLACRILEQAAPGVKIVPVRAEFLVVGLGALHCLSMQQPKA